MEATTKNQFKIGVFLVGGLAIMLISIFMIGGESSPFAKQIRLHAHFDQVQGLAEGSVVSLAGVNIGNIEKIEFLSDLNQLDTVMRIDSKYGPRIHEGTQVEIRTQGALGDKFIFLIPADPKNPPVKDGEVLDVAKASDIFSIIGERGKDTEHVFDIINEVYKMAKTINGDGRLDKMLSNMTVASGNFRDLSVEAHKITASLGADSGVKIAHTLERLDSLITKMDRGDGTIGALINDPTVHDQLKSILGGSSRGNAIKSVIRTSIEKSER